jgi:N-acetyl sugar amidotransferase
MIYCKKCLNVSTRPRITFDKDGVCNACQWSEKKKTIDWEERQSFFKKLCDKYRNKNTDFDCLVPWSGGKDSVYVACKMRDFGMKPLLITILPHLETDIGRWNRENLCSDFEHFNIKLNNEKYRQLAKECFIKDARPKHPWEVAISAIILQQAVELDLPFVIYGENGEQEYGGVEETPDEWQRPVSKEFLIKYYYSDNLVWPLPTDEQFENLFFTQWSKFENWQPSQHAHFAVLKGMKTEPVRNIGTLISTSQLSDSLQDLHMYLAFIKFGFGRCTSDVGIAIRDGWLARKEALEWVKHYDGEYPWKYHEEYLDYFKMSPQEYWQVIDGHANKEILEKRDNKWQLKKSPE